MKIYKFDGMLDLCHMNIRITQSWSCWPRFVKSNTTTTTFRLMLTWLFVILLAFRCACVTNRNKMLNAHKNYTTSNHISIRFFLAGWRPIESETSRIFLAQKQLNRIELKLIVMHGKQSHRFIDVASNCLWHSKTKQNCKKNWKKKTPKCVLLICHSATSLELFTFMCEWIYVWR